MEGDDRSKLIAKLQKIKLEKQSTNYGLHAQVATDFALKAPGSDLGVAVGVGVSLANSIFNEVNDGSMKFISQAFLPATFMGQELDTIEKANSALKDYSKNKLIKVAEDFNWSITCIEGCGSNREIYYLKSTENIASRYAYRPQEFIAILILSDVVEVKEDDFYTSLLGYDVKWKSEEGHKYILHLSAGIKYDDQNNMVFGEDGKTPKALYWLNPTRIGRDMMRAFYNDPFSIYGTSESFPKQVFHNGEIYSFQSNSNHMMINEIIIENELSLELTDINKK